MSAFAMLFFHVGANRSRINEFAIGKIYFDKIAFIFKDVDHQALVFWYRDNIERQED